MQNKQLQEFAAKIYLDWISTSYMMHRNQTTIFSCYTERDNYSWNSISWKNSKPYKYFCHFLNLQWQVLNLFCFEVLIMYCICMAMSLRYLRIMMLTTLRDCCSLVTNNNLVVLHCCFYRWDAWMYKLNISVQPKKLFQHYATKGNNTEGFADTIQDQHGSKSRLGNSPLVSWP